MEVTKSFFSFLEDLNNPNVLEKDMNHEIAEYILKIKEKLNTIDIDELLLKPMTEYSYEEQRLAERNILENSAKIYDDLRNALDRLCLMHVYGTNFSLDASNLIKFLQTYCNAIFNATKISIITQSYVPTLFNEEQVQDQQKKIAAELKEYMGDDEIKTMNLDVLPALADYLKGQDYIGNIAIRFSKNLVPFYIVLHFKNDSAFTGYFIAGKYYKNYPLTLEFISNIYDMVQTNSFIENKPSILRDLEILATQLIQLQKSYFLSFIASEVQTTFGCDVPTSLEIEQEEKSPFRGVYNKSLTCQKSIEIALLPNDRIDIRANFAWNNAKLNSQLSGIWGKLQNLSKIQEERNFYRCQLKTTNAVFLHFTKKGSLIYQSDKIPKDAEYLMDIVDFLDAPKARNMKFVLSRQRGFLKTIENLLKETEGSNPPPPIKTYDYENISFTFSYKRNEWKKITEDFCISFEKSSDGFSPNDISDLLADFEKQGDSQLNKSLDPFKKPRRGQTRHYTFDAAKILGDSVSIENLRKTIVSEYLPEELTRSNSNPEAIKRISATKKIKIGMTPKSAFRMLGEKVMENLKSQFATNNTEVTKPEQLTVQSFVAKIRDKENLNNWCFDISGVEDWIEQSRLVWFMLNQMNLLKEFNIDLDKLCKFVIQIRDGYMRRNNPYHNYSHGVSVMHATYYMIQKISTHFSNLVNLGLLISAFCHDVDHTGRTNLFEVNSSSELALIYHDRAVLEQHHAAYTFKILNKENCNIFSQIKIEERKELRKLIIANILATDVKEHFDLMKNFKELSDRAQAVGEDFVFKNEEVQVLTGMMIHCADLSGATKDFPIALSWSTKVNEEFSAQVKEETELKIPVTPYFKDLDKKHIMAKQEIAFISFMVKPLWELFNNFCGGVMQTAVNNIDNNLKEWNIILEKALKELEDNKHEENKN